MPNDTSIERRVEDIARTLEDKAGITPPLQRRDTTVESKLARINDALVGSSGTGALEGHDLGDHGDVDLTAPATDDFLQFDGTKWVDHTLVLGDLPAIGLDDLSDVVLTSEANLDILTYDGSDWVNFPIPRQTKSVTIEQPIAGDDIAIWRFPNSITIYQIWAVLVGSSTPSVDFDLRHAGFRSGTGTAILTDTVSSTTAGDSWDTGDLNDANLSSTRWVRIEIDSVSGTVDELCLVIWYDEDIT